MQIDHPIPKRKRIRTTNSENQINIKITAEINVNENLYSFISKLPNTPDDVRNARLDRKIDRIDYIIRNSVNSRTLKL